MSRKLDGSKKHPLIVLAHGGVHGNFDKSDGYCKIFSARNHIVEVQQLIAALQPATRYKIYQNGPGGHAFERIDTKLATESRAEIYKFLARYLKPGT